MTDINHLQEAALAAFNEMLECHEKLSDATMTARLIESELPDGHHIRTTLEEATGRLEAASIELHLAESHLRHSIVELAE